jgi:hypothetical protein
MLFPVHSLENNILPSEGKLIHLRCRWNLYLIILCVALKIPPIKHMCISYVNYIPCPFCDARDTLYFHIAFVDICLQKAILFRSIWRFQKLLYSQSRHLGFGCFFNPKRVLLMGAFYVPFLQPFSSRKNECVYVCVPNPYSYIVSTHHNSCSEAPHLRKYSEYMQLQKQQIYSYGHSEDNILIRVTQRIFSP